MSADRHFVETAYAQLLPMVAGRREATARAVGDLVAPAVMRAWPDASLLDVGTGDGELLGLLLRRLDDERAASGAGGSAPGFRRVVAIEPSSVMWASAAPSLAAACGDGCAEELHLVRARYTPGGTPLLAQPGQYSVILAVNVLYYFRGWRGLIASLLQLLSDDGALVVVLKSRETPLYRLRAGLPWPSVARPIVDAPFFAEDLEREMCEVGVVVERRTVSVPFQLGLDALGSLGKGGGRRFLAFLFGVPESFLDADVLETIVQWVGQLARSSNLTYDVDVMRVEGACGAGSDSHLRGDR